MPRLISSRQLHALLVATTAFLSPLKGHEAIDDANLKKSLQDGLTRIHDSGEYPAPAAIRRQLTKEATYRGHLPAKEETKAPSADGLYEHAKRATLVFGHLYLCGKCDNWHTSTASGILISADGLALTNYHVLDSERASIFGAMTPDGNVYAVEEVLAASKKSDIALVRLRTEEALPFVTMAGAAPIGTSVYVVSHPDSHFYALTKGHISRYSLTRQKSPRLEITAGFAKGSSGSGVFNQRGQVVGLVAATNSIYYDQDQKVQKNLQMVIKSCIPLSGINALFAERK